MPFATATISTEDELERRAKILLGVNENTDPKTLKRNYRKLAFRYHPDRSPETCVQYMAVVGAYKLLTGKREPLSLCDVLNDKLIEDMTGQTVTPIERTKTREQLHTEQFYDMGGKSIWP